MELLAAIPPSGGYLSLTKAIAMLVLLVPWFWSATWVNRDLARFAGTGKYWALVVLAAGGVSVAMWFLIPSFAAGTAIYIVSTCGAMAAYIMWRNLRLGTTERIFTLRFFRSAFGKKLHHAQEVKLLDHVGIYDTSDRLIRPSRDDLPLVIYAYNRLQLLFYEALRRRASHAQITPGEENKYHVHLVVDGLAINWPSMTMPAEHGHAAIQFMKRAGRMDIENVRRPQKGIISVDNSGNRVDIAIASSGTTGGQELRLTVLKEAVHTNLSELGMERHTETRVKEAIRSQRGLIIVSGLAGSGITSTMYSLLRQFDAFVMQLVTLESDPPVDLENITQKKYDDPRQLPDVLASVLRRRPDVLMIDHCPDVRSAQLILEAAADRLIILSVHADSTFLALAKWLKICGGAPAEAKAVENLHLVLCQMLVRKLCLRCRESYRPDAQLLAKANLTGMDVEKFYRTPTSQVMNGNGKVEKCPNCLATGYQGRTGVFEMIDMTDHIRQLIADAGSLSQIKAACRKNKMLYLQEQALKKVVEGITGVKEIIRVTQRPGKRKT